MDGGIVVRVRSAAAASTSTHWQQCSGSSSSSHLPLHKHTAAFFPCSREELFAGGRVRQDNAVCCPPCAGAVAREVPEANGMKVEGSRKLLHGTRKMQGLELTSPHERGEKQAAGTLMSPLPGPAAADISADPSSGMWITAMAAAIIEMERRKQEEEESTTATRLVLPIDTLWRGRLVENDLVYRQAFIIRSYEAGFDRIASIETISNLFQETALNHVGMSTFVGDGMGTTHAMMRHRLIWVVTRMHVEVNRYPVWGDVVEIDSWVAAEGKNGMRRDFLVRDITTGHVISRATSTWVMMNQDTRRLSKMPKEVLDEISPYFLDRSVMKDNDGCQRIKKLTDTAPYIRSDLVPRLNDMDMNQHVNNVKYIGWVLESVPQSLSVAHELTSMTLEYRRECTPSDIVQSLSCPDPPLPVTNSLQQSHDNGSALLGNGALDGSPGAVSCSSGALKSATLSPPTVTSVHYTHLLRMQSDGTEILRGRTSWRLKQRYNCACY